MQAATGARRKAGHREGGGRQAGSDSTHVGRQHTMERGRG